MGTLFLCIGVIIMFLIPLGLIVASMIDTCIKARFYKNHIIYKLILPEPETLTTYKTVHIKDEYMKKVPPPMVKLFIKILISKNAYKSFIEYTARTYLNAKKYAEQSIYHNPIRIHNGYRYNDFYNLFSWNLTKEGSTFWFNIYREWEKEVKKLEKKYPDKFPAGSVDHFLAGKTHKDFVNNIISQDFFTDAFAILPF